MPAPCILEICNLSRRDSQREKTLLGKTSLKVHGGDRIGLVGASGSGKSTLLRGIAMLDRCDGDVRYAGKSIRGDDVPAYRRNVVYLPQRPAFITGSVLENLQLPFEFAASSSLGNASVAFNPVDAEQSIVQLGLPAEVLQQPTESLSGGEQQLVALARALSLHPQILLLDEPTAALDGVATTRFEQRVMEWQSQAATGGQAKRAFLWTSHDPAQVHRLTDRVMTMEAGILQTPETTRTGEASHD